MRTRSGVAEQHSYWNAVGRLVSDAAVMLTQDLERLARDFEKVAVNGRVNKLQFQHGLR